MLPHIIKVKNSGNEPLSFIVFGKPTAPNFDNNINIQIHYDSSQRVLYPYIMFLTETIERKLKVKNVICDGRKFKFESTEDRTIMKPDGWLLAPNEEITIQLEMEE